MIYTRTNTHNQTHTHMNTYTHTCAHTNNWGDHQALNRMAILTAESGCITIMIHHNNTVHTMFLYPMIHKWLGMTQQWCTLQLTSHVKMGFKSVLCCAVARALFPTPPRSWWWEWWKMPGIVVTCLLCKTPKRSNWFLAQWVSQNIQMWSHVHQKHVITRLSCPCQN